MNEVPVPLFILMSFLTFIFLIISVYNSKIINIFAGIVATMLAYTLSKISINGMLCQVFGGVSSTDTVITNTTTIIYMPMSYIFLFISLISTLILIANVLTEVQFNLQPDLNLEGDY